MTRRLTDCLVGVSRTGCTARIAASTEQRLAKYPYREVIYCVPSMRISDLNAVADYLLAIERARPASPESCFPAGYGKPNGRRIGESCSKYAFSKVFATDRPFDGPSASIVSPLVRLQEERRKQEREENGTRCSGIPWVDTAVVPIWFVSDMRRDELLAAMRPTRQVSQG